MANGWAPDSAVQDQIEDTVADAVKRARHSCKQATALTNATIAVRTFRPRGVPLSRERVPVSAARRHATPSNAVPGSIGAAARTVSFAEPMAAHPVTPDGRYFVVRGRLWRMANPALPEDRRKQLVAELMAARRAVGTALRAGDKTAEREARAAVDAVKQALGERGPVWWKDSAPDLNRHLARTTIYADWFAELTPGTAASANARPPGHRPR